MTVVTLRARGRAAVDVAWERYADPSSWSGWAPQIRRVDASAPRLVAGMTGTVHGPPGIAVTFVVDEVDENARSWAWTARLGPVVLRLHHRVWEHGRGSATSLILGGPLPVVVSYAPVAQYALKRLVRV